MPPKVWILKNRCLKSGFPFKEVEWGLKVWISETHYREGIKLSPIKKVMTKQNKNKARIYV